MKNFLLAFLVFLVWSFFGLWLYSWLQPIERVVQKNENIATVDTNESGLDINDPIQLEENTSTNTLVIDSVKLSENTEDPAVINASSTGLKATTSSGDVLFLFPEGVTIWKNTDMIEYPSSISDFKYKINTYLIEHPKEEVHISSLYSASENIENPNFGIQRGRKIKSILERTGVASNRIVVKPVIREISFEEDGVFRNGISFSFAPLDEERIASLKLFVPETKTMYPTLVNDDVVVDKALQDLLQEVKEAIAADPNLIVEIVGHTDNIGNANDNYLLGLKHARQVRWYLIAKGGIDRNKVVAISEGESKSIATNRTERGRLLNRRIEVVYKSN